MYVPHVQLILSEALVYGTEVCVCLGQSKPLQCTWIDDNVVALNFGKWKGYDKGWLWQDTQTTIWLTD